MAQTIYHPSVEGAQHGAKGLEKFLDFAKASGATGAQPSNFMLNNDKGGLRSAKDILAAFEARGLTLDGISCHCPTWVHTTAWTGSPTIKPFLSKEIAAQSPDKIEKWCENYLLKLMDLAVEMKIKILPTFWGVAFGWEMATGYPWGFWQAGYDMLKEGQDRFVKKTAKIRKHANELGVYLCHEIHPGTAAMCADDFNMLVKICDGDKCLGVNADPSHCWEGESFETRFLKVADRVHAAHVKNYTIRQGMPLRMMDPNWQKRPMQFTDLPSGDLNMVRYAELLTHIGYPQRYCKIMGRPTAPLVVEAESAYRDLDAASGGGIAYVRDHMCFPLAAGSFEDGMGA